MTQTEPLAIDGGSPVFPDGPPDWPPRDDAIRRALEAALSDGSWGRYHGPHGERLIEALAVAHGVNHVLLCASGTIAVELALRGVGVEAGDEVILAGYDFPGNFRAVEAIGARPVLVDIDRVTCCLDPEQLPDAWSPQVRAVLVSHLHGGLAPMRQIVELAAAKGVRVVEDACQVPGAVVDGRAAGSWGDAGVLSFGGSKLLTSGRGGAVLTPHADVLQRIKVFSERGNDAFPLSELQAAVLLPQIEQLAASNARRAENVARLQSRTSSHASLRNVGHPAPAESSYYKLAWRLEGEGAADGAPLDREAFIRAVRAEGVALDAGFRGFVRRSERRCRRVGSLPLSRDAADRLILLHHPILLAEAERADRVAKAFYKVIAALTAC